MSWKKTITMIIFFTIVWLFLSPFSGENAAQAKEAIDSIELKESPYEIGEGWTVDSSYMSIPPYSLTFGEKEYLAVGPHGTIMKSTDGRNWKALSKFGGYQLTTVAWDGTKYVMFGANREFEREASYAPSEAFVSTDALKWQKINFEPGEAILGLEWGKDKFVAVGRKHVFTSSDGHNWKQTLKFKVEYGWHSVRYVHDTYFITNYEEGKVYTSKDGENWLSKPLNTKANIQDMIWDKDHYLGVGKGFYISKDGISWTKQGKSPNNVNFKSIVTNGKTYMAVGSLEEKGSNRTVTFTSNNGVNWKQHNPTNYQVDIYTMYPVNGGFAGIGSTSQSRENSDGTYSVFTSDGIKWSSSLVGTSIAGEFSGIATNGKRTVAVGHQGNIIYTDNGTKWRSANTLPYRKGIGRPYLFDVAWGANKFVAVGHDGAYVSSDGVSWKKAKITFKDQYGNLTKILWTGKFFIASDQVYGVYMSTDGLTWKKVNSISSDWLRSMIWDGKRVVATFQVHNNGNSYTKIMQTTNGTKWTQLAKLNYVEDLAWNGKYYVAANQNFATQLWVSSDGRKWTKAAANLDPNDRFSFITSFDGYFFAYSDSFLETNGKYTFNNSYYVSKDGIKWTRVPIPSNESHRMFDGVKAHGKYIFVGEYDDMMYTSKLRFE